MRILTRGSALALVQAERMAAVLRESGCPVEIVPWATRGDRDTDSPLCSFGGSGAFSGCIEEALLLGKGDGAVHSLKDIPSCCRPGLEIAAVLPRDSSADVLVCRENSVFDTLPEGASVGTSSPRRKAQILRIRPDLSVNNIRGNLSTRLQKLEDGQYDAIILAAAGLTRLGMGERIRSVMPAEVSLPAAGQGALGIECLAARKDVIGWLQPLVDADTTACVLAERAVARALAGSCEVPLGAYAVTREGRLWLRGFVARPDGSEIVRAEREGAPANADALGCALADDLRGQGAEAILADIG